MDGRTSVIESFALAVSNKRAPATLAGWAACEISSPEGALHAVHVTARINPTRYFMSVSPPPSSEPSDRKTVDRLVPELVRKLLESGASLTAEGIRQALGELKLPKEALSQALGQLEETRSGLYRSVSREV